MPETPVLVRNTKPGPTVFDDGQRIIWEGSGQPGDVQQVPLDIVRNPNVLRLIARGSLELMGDTVPGEARDSIYQQIEFMRSTMPAREDGDDDPWKALGTIPENQEGPDGRDKEVQLTPIIDPHQRG